LADTLAYFMTFVCTVSLCYFAEENSLTL